MRPEPRIGEELIFRHPCSTVVRRVKVLSRRGQGTMWLCEDTTTGQVLAASSKHLRHE